MSNMKYMPSYQILLKTKKWLLSTFYNLIRTEKIEQGELVQTVRNDYINFQ